MESKDVQKEVLWEVDILGKKALFTELRVEKSTVPEGVYCYALRHGDDESFPEEAAETVGVNYFGSVLMTEKLELGKTGNLSLSYEDFSYTGEKMRLEEYLAKSKDREAPEPVCFQSGEGLAVFLKPTFPITDMEGEKLVGYMEEHGFLLGQKDGELYRGDFCYEQEKVHWEPYSIDDAVNVAAQWNYDFLQEAEAAMLDPKDTSDFFNKESYLDSLREDEKMLDSLFDRTKYGKELDELAEKLVEEFIQDLQSPGGIDGAIQKMTEEIAAEKELLPDGSPSLKQNKGRSK